MLAFFTLSILALAVAAAPFDKRACSPLELVFARGTSEIGLGIVGNPLSSKLSDLVPGTTTYNVNYSSSAEYFVTVAQGANDAAKHIQQQASACPDQKFAIAGYSKGAMVAHQTQLPADVQSRVVAVAVFGDPLRLTGDTLPLDDQKNVVAFCNTGDPVCQNGGNALAHIRYGTDGSVTKAAEFIAAKFKA